MSALKNQKLRDESGLCAEFDFDNFSLTPCFSWVLGGVMNIQPFQRFFRAPKKPLKRFSRFAISNPQLKQGVNEIGTLKNALQLKAE
ncbi:MAG: hypothetical protein ABJC04_04645 [Verrucomicrobiota bacterium]